MASLQIRDMPEDLYDSLKRSAERDHRSLTQQALVLLSSALETSLDGSGRRRQVLKEIKERGVQTLSKLKEIDISVLVREDRER